MIRLAIDYEKMHDIAHDLLPVFIKSYQDKRGVSAETLIGGLAAVTGDHVLRTFVDADNCNDFWIISDEVDTFLSVDTYDSLSIDSYLSNFGKEAGYHYRNVDRVKTIIKRTAAAIGGEIFPPLTIPKNHYPYEYSPNAAVRYRATMKEIFDAHVMTKRERAICCTYLTGQAIVEAKDVLDPDIAYQLALEMIVGVSKMNIQEEIS